MIALMGPSGCGKTTLLATATKLQLPTSGHVRQVWEGPARTEWVVQSSPLLTRRTALANVMLGPLSVGAKRVDAAHRAWEALRALGVDGVATHKVFRLSGGEQQRVAVARAVASASEFVVADEPTASLDAASRASVCASLVEAARRGALVLVATHDPEVAACADRVVMLEQHAAPPTAKDER
jgi:ABC-type lipoprotein export system ATPase subunit